MEKPRLQWLEWIREIVSVVLVCGVIYYGITLFEETAKWGIIFLSLCIITSAITSIKDMAGKSFFAHSGKLNNLIAGAVILLAIVSAAYLHTEYNALNWERAGVYNPLDTAMGFGILILVLSLTWKDQGPAIPITAIIFMLYMFFGPYLPGIFFHAGLGWKRILHELTVTMDGIYGLINQIGATWIAIFLIFAGFLSGFRTLAYIIGFVHRIIGNRIENIPQLAVIGSMMFGLFSGSAAANVAGTGSFTIPLMKGIGVPPAKAGAIEAVASSCGQIMPPIMGAAAFLMASFLQTTYLEIVKIAIIPALIMYISLGVAVFVMMRRMGIKGISSDKASGNIKIEKVKIADGIPLFLSILLFIYAMAILNLNAMTSGVILVLSLVASQFIYCLTKPKPKILSLKEFKVQLLSGFKEAADYCATLGAMLALLGVVVRGLIVTGLSQRLAFGMVDLAGQNLIFLLLLVMGLSILFGMAVSTVACYIIVVLLAAPSLQELGVNLTISHFVVFYFSMLSAITPPVAVASAVGAGIAKAPFFKTSWESMKFGAALFFLPFSFIAHPDILLGPIGRKLLAALIILMGTMALTSAFQLAAKGWKMEAVRISLIIFGILCLFIPY